MATLPTRTLCADLVTQLTAAAVPGVNDLYRRAYFVRTADKGDAALAWTAAGARRVTICPGLPTAYRYEAATRGENLYTHEVSVLVEKRFTDAGDATTDWLDTEVDWVYTNIVLGFDWDFRSGAIPTFNRKLVTLSSEVQLFDLDEMLRQKLFTSQVDITFQELVSA